jgi:hypothetical protein
MQRFPLIFPSLGGISLRFIGLPASNISSPRDEYARNLKKIDFLPNFCALLSPAGSIGLEKRTGWEILLGQRGSKTSL